MGFIKLSHKLLEWEWYDNTNVKVLFIHCLLKANYKPGSWHGIHYEAGQFITSLSTLSKETGQTIRMVRDNLDKLILTGELTSTNLPKGRMITVNNWKLYQAKGKDDDKEMTSTLTRKPTRNRATDKEYKEDKEYKNKYYEDSELDKAFSDYVAMRTKIRKPLSDRAVELAKGKLHKLSGGDRDKSIEILNQSILGSWQGLYELKQDAKTTKPNSFSNFGQRTYDFEALERDMRGD